MNEHPVTDPYGITAEFYDLTAAPYWERLRGALLDALAGADPSAGPVLDVGAGTGLSTEAIAQELPDASVVAIEPSRAQRAVLFSRLVQREDLRRRVTVLPLDLGAYLAEADLPRRLGGAAALGMLGHLSREERVSLWQFLGERLVPGAPAVIQIQPPERPEKIPPTRYARAQVGERIYEGWGAARPEGTESLRWTMTYRVLRNDALLEEHKTDHSFRTISERDVANEAGAAGLSCQPAEEGLLVLRTLDSPDPDAG